jgi:hypothetical protein
LVCCATGRLLSGIQLTTQWRAEMSSTRGHFREKQLPCLLRCVASLCERLGSCETESDEDGDRSLSLDASLQVLYFVSSHLLPCPMTANDPLQAAPRCRSGRPYDLGLAALSVDSEYMTEGWLTASHKKKVRKPPMLPLTCSVTRCSPPAGGASACIR